MVDFLNMAGQILYRVTDSGEITDFYGRRLYYVQNNELHEYSSRKMLFSYDGRFIKDFSFRTHYQFEGEDFKMPYGSILYTYRNNKIAKFASLPEYQIRGYASNMVVAFLILLFVIGI